MKEKFLKVGKWIGILFVLGIVTLFSINFFIKSTTKNQIIEQENLISIENVDAILV